VGVQPGNAAAVAGVEMRAVAGAGSGGRYGYTYVPALHTAWVEALVEHAGRSRIPFCTAVGAVGQSGRTGQLVAAWSPSGWLARAAWEAEGRRHDDSSSRPLTALLWGSSSGMLVDSTVAAAWSVLRNAAGADSAWASAPASRLASLAQHLQDRWCIRPAGLSSDDGGGAMPAAPLALLCPRHLAPLVHLAGLESPPSASALDPTAGLYTTPCHCASVLAPSPDSVPPALPPHRRGYPYAMPAPVVSALYLQTWPMNDDAGSGGGTPVTVHGLIRAPASTPVRCGVRTSEQLPTTRALEHGGQQAPLPFANRVTAAGSAFRRRTVEEVATTAGSLLSTRVRWGAAAGHEVGASASAASTIPSSAVHSASASGSTSRDTSPPPSPLSELDALPLSLPGFLADEVAPAPRAASAQLQPAQDATFTGIHVPAVPPWDAVGLDAGTWAAQPVRLRLPTLLWLAAGVPLPCTHSQAELDHVEGIVQDALVALTIPPPPLPPGSHPPDTPVPPLPPTCTARFPLGPDSARRLNRSAAIMLAMSATDEVRPSAIYRSGIANAAGWFRSAGTSTVMHGGMYAHPRSHGGHGVPSAMGHFGLPTSAVAGYSSHVRLSFSAYVHAAMSLSRLAGGTVRMLETAAMTTDSPPTPSVAIPTAGSMPSVATTPSPSQAARDWGFGPRPTVALPRPRLSTPAPRYLVSWEDGYPLVTGTMDVRAHADWSDGATITAASDDGWSVADAHAHAAGGAGRTADASHFSPAVTPKHA